MAAVGVPLLAVQLLHAGPLAVSALPAAAYVPWLVIGLPAGAWVDRRPARPLMIACDLVAALLFASLPVAAWLGILTIGQLIAVALLAGAASVLFSTAYQVLLPALVRPADLLEGNAKLQGSAEVAAISGRGLAGLAAHAAGDAGALFINAASFLVSAACLLLIRAPAARRPEAAPPEAAPPEAAPPEAAPPEARRPVRAEVAAGLRLVGRDRLLAVLTAYPALANLTTAGVISLQVLFLVRVVGVGTAVTGLLLAVGPAGGVAGAVAARPAARRLGTARVLLIASLGFPLLGLLIGLTTRGAGMAWYVAGAAAETAGGVAGSIILTSFRQAYVPPAMLGRVVASQRFIAFGAIPLGALAAGGLGTAIGVRGAIWVMLAAYPLSGVLLLTRPILGHRDLPARPDEPAGPAATARSE